MELHLNAEVENELMHLSDNEVSRRILDMQEFIEDPSWSLELTLSAVAYLPMLKIELEQRKALK